MAKTGESDFHLSQSNTLNVVAYQDIADMEAKRLDARLKKASATMSENSVVE